jgi:mannose/cellobiose epimerase-like protein (N-acyl-D-glucosamine 2-epimerase family)
MQFQRACSDHYSQAFAVFAKAAARRNCEQGDAFIGSGCFRLLTNSRSGTKALMTTTMFTLSLK